MNRRGFSARGFRYGGFDAHGFAPLARLPPVAGVPTDGPDVVHRPESAAHWVSLGLPAPLVQWNCQDASGGIAASFGSGDWTENSTGQLYQQTVDGWAAKAVGVPDGIAGGWNNATASLDCGLDESFAWLFYLSAIPAADARIILRAGGNAWRIRTSGVAGTVQGTWNSVGANLVGGHHAIGVYPLIWGRDCTALRASLITSLGQVNGTYSGAAFVGDQTQTIGGPGGASALTRYLTIAFWKGADAATILSRTTLEALRW